MIMTQCSILKKKRNICKIVLGGHGAAYSCMQSCDEILAQAWAGGRQHTEKKTSKKKTQRKWSVGFPKDFDDGLSPPSKFGVLQEHDCVSC